MGEAVIRAYLCREAPHQIGEKLKCSRSTADRLVKIAEGYVSGYLDGGIEESGEEAAAAVAQVGR